jgi:hypothetical protein
MTQTGDRWLSQFMDYLAGERGYRRGAFNGAAALALMGGNQTLAEALMTLQLLTPERK